MKNLKIWVKRIELNQIDYYSSQDLTLEIGLLEIKNRAEISNNQFLDNQIGLFRCCVLLKFYAGFVDFPYAFCLNLRFSADSA